VRDSQRRPSRRASLKTITIVLAAIRLGVPLKRIGRYEILRELGRGAMGIVFKARDPVIGRIVALKAITANVADDSDLMERFRREAKTAGALQHPNIVTV
jgi:eukaryotic-like serine/threonine-protein kinase